MLRRVFTIVPVILLVGAALLLFFVNLAGAKHNGFLGDFYWSEVNSSDLGTSWDKTRWTLYSLCGVKDGKNYDCTSNSPAYPYSPADNFDSVKNLPSTFTKHRDTYYYLSRFAYVFFLIGIVFAILALIPTVLSCCLKGFVSGILSSIATGISLLFTAAGAAFITAVHVKGRNAFNDAGYSASLRTRTFAVLWAAVACLAISFIWMCVVSGKGATKKFNNRHSQTDAHESYAETKGSTTSSNNDNLMYNQNEPYNNPYHNNQYPYESQYQEEEPKKKKFFFSRS